jgi:hypothetical protein
MPLPRCPHSLIPKDAITSAHLAPRGELFMSRRCHSTIVTLMVSAFKVCRFLGHHHRFVLLGTPRLWIVGVVLVLVLIHFCSKREKKIRKYCNQTTFSVFKLLSLLTFCDIFDHWSYSIFNKNHIFSCNLFYQYNKFKYM